MITLEVEIAQSVQGRSPYLTTEELGFASRHEQEICHLFTATRLAGGVPSTLFNGVKAALGLKLTTHQHLVLT
jgi:hypothetical protein